jgi:hypothetical protein
MSDNVVLERPASADAPQPSPPVFEGEVHHEPDASELPTKPDVLTRNNVASAMSAAEQQRAVFEATAEEVAAKPLPNFDPLIAEAKAGWLHWRDARLVALFGAVPAYQEALRFPDAFAVYCRDRKCSARFPETAVFELMVAADEERGEIGGDTRARCGAMIVYFAEECRDMTAEEAAAHVKANGGLVKVADAWRKAHPQVALKEDGSERKRPGRKPGPGGTRHKSMGATSTAATTTSTGEVVRLGGKPVDLSELPPEVQQQIAEKAEETKPAEPREESHSVGEQGEAAPSSPAEAEEAAPVAEANPRPAEGIEGLRQECRDAFERFMASHPSGEVLAIVTGYLNTKIAA